MMRESGEPPFDFMSSSRLPNFHCSAIFSLFLWSVLIPSCRGYVNWIYPSKEDNDLVFNYIDTVYFTWTSSIRDPYMNLWCAPSPTVAQSSTYGRSHLALRDPQPIQSPSPGGKPPKRINQALKCGETYSVPRRSLNQWHKPSVIPIQRLFQ